MPISDRLAAFLADRSQVLTRKRDILYLFGDIAYCESDDYPEGKPEDDAEMLEDLTSGLDHKSTEQPSKADDLSAFLILERLAPSAGHRAVEHAEHDQIWLGWEIKSLKGKATVQDILNLQVLGVHVEDDSLIMYR